MTEEQESPLAGGLQTMAGIMTPLLRPGWLDRQFKKVAEDIKKWPDWMKMTEGDKTKGG